MREDSGRFGAKPDGRVGLTPGLHAVYFYLGLAPGDPWKLPVRKAGSWPAELMDGRLPTARPTAPPSLAMGLSMRSSASDAAKGSQTGLGASIPEFGELETPWGQCSTSLPLGTPPPQVLSGAVCPWEVPGVNKLITGSACKVIEPIHGPAALLPPGYVQRSTIQPGKSGPQRHLGASVS